MRTRDVACFAIAAIMTGVLAACSPDDNASAGVSQAWKFDASSRDRMTGALTPTASLTTYDQSVQMHIDAWCTADNGVALTVSAYDQSGRPAQLKFDPDTNGGVQEFALRVSVDGQAEDGRDTHRDSEPDNALVLGDYWFHSTGENPAMPVVTTLYRAKQIKIELPLADGRLPVAQFSPQDEGFQQLAKACGVPA